MRLPGAPGSPEFHAAYAKLLEPPVADNHRYDPGSVAHTIHLYLNSAKFSKLSPGTQRDYQRYLARLDNSVGERPLASINEDYIHRLQDKLKDTPSASNHMLAVVRTLFRYAIKRGIITQDPTSRAERLPGGDPYMRWGKEAIKQFRASASPTMALALDLALGTGQRLGDIIAMKWGAFDGKRIKVVQQKTGTPLSILVHADLLKTLSKSDRKAPTILTSRSGLPFHPRVFSRDFRDARIKAGLSDDYVFHGLRHTAAAVLAESGCTAPEIQAITGHKSLKLVEHYIRQAEQERLADVAIGKLPKSAKPRKR